MTPPAGAGPGWGDGSLTPAECSVNSRSCCDPSNRGKAPQTEETSSSDQFWGPEASFLPISRTSVLCCGLGAEGNEGTPPPPPLVPQAKPGSLGGLVGVRTSPALLLASTVPTLTSKLLGPAGTSVSILPQTLEILTNFLLLLAAMLFKVINLNL